MSEVAVGYVATLFAIVTITNLVLTLANLKLYTEIMKEKSQRERGGGEGWREQWMNDQLWFACAVQRDSEMRG